MVSSIGNGRNSTLPSCGSGSKNRPLVVIAPTANNKREILEFDRTVGISIAYVMTEQLHKMHSDLARRRFAESRTDAENVLRIRSGLVTRASRIKSCFHIDTKLKFNCLLILYFFKTLNVILYF